MHCPLSSNENKDSSYYLSLQWQHWCTNTWHRVATLLVPNKADKHTNTCQLAGCTNICQGLAVFVGTKALKTLTVYTKQHQHCTQQQQHLHAIATTLHTLYNIRHKLKNNDNLYTTLRQRRQHWQTAAAIAHWDNSSGKMSTLYYDSNQQSLQTGTSNTFPLKSATVWDKVVHTCIWSVSPILCVA